MSKSTKHEKAGQEKKKDQQRGEQRAASGPDNGQRPESEARAEEAVDIEAMRAAISEKLSDDEEGVVADFDQLADRAAELNQIQEELTETKDQLMRQAASFRNFRRRMEQEQERHSREAKGKVVRRMLAVLDDMGRTIEAVHEIDDQEEPDYEAAYQSLKEGVEMVYEKFNTELGHLGVEPIEAEGKPFDENEHEAMMQQPTEDVPEGTVLQEVQKGYRMGDRVLRHARVVVAGGA